MKTIFYRKKYGSYQRGLFIPFEHITAVLILLNIFLTYKLIFDFSTESSSSDIVYQIVNILGLLILTIYLSQDNEVNILPNQYKSIDTYRYVKKLLRKKKGAPEIPNPKHFSLITDNEYKSVITYHQELLSFYSECQKSILELRKNCPDEISIIKTDRLIRELANRKYTLESFFEKK